MRLPKILAILAFMLPSVAFAAFSVPLVATTTTGTIFAYPTSVNTIYPAVMSPFFLATSTTATSSLPRISATGISSTWICFTGDTCRTTWPTGGGSSFAWPFTAFANYNSTSTPIGFIQGLFSTASSTFNSAVSFTNRTVANLAYFGTNGLLQDVATTTASCSGAASCTAFTVIGSSPITISASGGSGSAFPFTPSANYNSTSTVIGFFGGLFSTASSTFNGPFRLSAIADGMLTIYNGLVGSAATTTAGTGLSYSGNAFNVNTSQNIATLSNLTGNGFVKTSGGTGALSVDTNTYLTGNQTVTLSGAVTGSGATAITTAFGTAAANTVLANGTGATAIPTFVSTTSLYTGTAGQVLAFLGGAWTGVATTTFSSPLTYAAGVATIQAASNSLNGYLSSFDFSLIHAATSTFTSPLVYTLGTNAVTCPTCSTFAYLFPGNATTTGLGIYASTTIGAGTDITGLTINGGATSTGPISIATDTFRISSIGRISRIENTSVNISANAFQMSAGGTDLLFQNNSNVAASGIKLQAGGSALNADVNAAVKFFVGSLERARVNGLGMFGIGSTTPWATLSVNGAWNQTGPTFVVATTTLTGTTTQFMVQDNGNVGVATTSPGTVFSIGSIANFAAATSSLYGSGGFNITDGCFAFRGTCINTSGGGAVSSVSNADGTLTISPTTGAVVASLALSKANTWTGLQTFNGGASSTGQMSMASASTTGLVISGTRNALLTTDAAGIVSGYAGSTCTNQFVRSLNGSGVATCATVANTDLANSTISGISLGGTLNSLSHDTTLTGTSYNGSATVSNWGLDLTKANVWTGLQSFNGGASSTGEITSVTSSSTNEIVSSIRSALHLGDANGVVSGYGGTTCTGQYIASLNGAGVATCGTLGVFGYPFTNTTYAGAAAAATTTILYANIVSATSSIGNLTAGAVIATSSINVPVSGILKGNGVASAVTAAANGTDFSLITALSCSAGQHLATVTALGAFTCTADSGGSTYPFTPATWGTLAVSATTTAIQDFAGFISATSTIGSFTATSSITNIGVKSALVLDDSTGLETAYGGSVCTNQYVLSLNGSGVATCGTLGVFGYPFTAGNNYNIATAATTSAIFAQGGLFASTTVAFGNALQPMFYFNGTTGNTGHGTTTPAWLVQLASSTISNTMTGQLALSDLNAGTNKKHWIVASEGGNFYHATSSDILATSTVPAFMLDTNGWMGLATSSPGSLLSLGGTGNGINFGYGTSTFSMLGGINLNAGCFSIRGTCLSGTNLLPLNNVWTGLNSFTNTGTTTFTGALSVSGWTLSTSTTVCLYPQHCQYPASPTTADTAINAAITYLQGAGGGTVNIMRGTYTLNAPILIAGDGITLKGEDNNATILILKNSFNDYAIKVNDASLRQRLEFRNFKIDGNRANQTSGGCIMASSTARSTIDTMWLEGCYEDALKLAGLAGGGFAYNNTISNNYIANNINGIEIVQNDENQIFANTINSSSQYHIYDRQGLNNIHDNVFTGVVYNTGIGIFVNFTQNTTIHHNTFDSVPQENIKIVCNSTQGQHLITDNNFFRSGFAATGKPTISVNGCTRNQFTNNYVDETSLSPFAYQEVSTAPTATYFSGNRWFGTSSPMSMLATGNASTTEFWDNSTSTPLGGMYWAQVDGTGQIGFNTPTGYGYKFGSNGTNLLSILTGGNVGIGTSTPSATLSVQSPTGVINVMVAGLIGATQYVFHVIDKFGHVVTGGPVPTVGTCGTAPAISGNDTNFRVLAGSGVISACTVTFANTYTKAPVCNIQQETGTGFAVIASSTLTTVLISGATLTSDWFVGHCESYQ